MVSKYFYAVYNQKEESVTVGTGKEVARFIGITYESLKCRLSRIKHGTLKGNSFKYAVYKIEEGED